MIYPIAVPSRSLLGQKLAPANMKKGLHAALGKLQLLCQAGSNSESVRKWKRGRNFLIAYQVTKSSYSFANCFLRVPVVNRVTARNGLTTVLLNFVPSPGTCHAACCQGKLGELSEKKCAQYLCTWHFVT